ncbi:protein-glutamate O-methyltransferase CheR [Natroniella sulfidigena]|uniref:CheR family methyltransferase n=1 Tax=Natroniella sulfidigena TaxID=723921 RepID=UPI00200A58B2|nr:protein-glutamate O-methyltransferase CheR [Natroniella sulfidigena]MCK8816823.1 protein-glutamate O-methyltransferase CheR [Natroniella sulfidigena]
MEEKRAERLSEVEFNTIRQLVADSIGVNLTTKKKQLVISRLSKRLRKLGLSDFSQYLELVEEDKKEKEMMFNLITTNVTHFFREEHHFDYLTEELFPQLEEQAEAKKKSKRVRIWSAACSTGEEAYSVAIVAADYFRDKGWKIEILASDINTEVLSVAKRGVYSKEQVKKIPYHLLTDYFKLGVGPNQGLLKVKEKLSKMITFYRINLAADRSYPIAEPLDIILCRNVFIYFNQETQNEIINRFYQHLTEGGLLLMGHSEKINLLNQGSKWELIRPTIYQKLP